MSKPSENVKRTVVYVGDGRGFIVSAGESRYVLTAAHCLPHSKLPRPHLANSIPELTFPKIIGPLASKHQTIWAELCAFSLTDDLAAFSEPDRQELYDQCEQYERFTEAAMMIGKPPVILAPHLWETDGDGGLRVLTRRRMAALHRSAQWRQVFA